MLEFFEIGQRLKEERERLGLSQAHFAGIGDLTKQAQINYEQGKRSPDAAYLAALAQHTNIDILYVITGKHTITNDSMNASEVELLKSYRSFDSSGKKAIDAVVNALNSRELNDDSNPKNDGNKPTYSNHGNYVAQGNNASVSIGSDAKIESLTIDEAERKLQQLDKCLRIVKFKFLTHHTVWPFLGLILFLAALPIMDRFSYSFGQEHPYIVIAAAVLLFFSMWRMFVKRRALFDYLEEGRARYKLIRKNITVFTLKTCLVFLPTVSNLMHPIPKLTNHGTIS
jgi:transcriptional regulator with XRE-family HTH domain